MTAELKGDALRTLSLLPWKSHVHVRGCLRPALVYCGGGCADRTEVTLPVWDGPHDGQNATLTNRLFTAWFGMCRNKLGGFVGGIDSEFLPTFR